VNLVEPDALPALRAAVETGYARRTGYSPRVFPVTPAAGAGLLEGAGR